MKWNKFEWTYFLYGVFITAGSFGAIIIGAIDKDIAFVISGIIVYAVHYFKMNKRIMNHLESKEKEWLEYNKVMEG